MRKYVYEDYKLADYIKKGVIYHNGSISKPIRDFIEDLYVNVPEIKTLVNNSALLEGVSIPTTKMFILGSCRGSCHNYDNGR